MTGKRTGARRYTVLALTARGDYEGERRRTELSDPELYVEGFERSETGEQIMVVSVWRRESTDERMTVTGSTTIDADAAPAPGRRRPTRKTSAR